MYYGDSESSLEIIHIYILECVEYFQKFAVCKVIGGCETEFLTYCQEEWNLFLQKIYQQSKTLFGVAAIFRWGL